MEQEPPTDEPPYEPPDEPDYETPEDSFPWWILVIPLVCLGIMAVAAAALVMTIRKARLKKTWQKRAQLDELPKNCQPSTYINRRESIDLKPGRWKVNGLKVTFYDSAKNKRGKTYAAPSSLVSNVDKAARQRLVGGEDDTLRGMIAEMAKELSALIIGWQSASELEKNAYIEAHMEGGSAEVKFARYQCVGQPWGWKKILEWTAKLTAVDHLPAALRAPLEAESQAAYQVYIEKQLAEYISTIITEAARLL